MTTFSNFFKLFIVVFATNLYIFIITIRVLHWQSVPFSFCDRHFQKYSSPSSSPISYSIFVYIPCGMQDQKVESRGTLFSIWDICAIIRSIVLSDVGKSSAQKYLVSLLGWVFTSTIWYTLICFFFFYQKTSKIFLQKIWKR